MSHLSPTLTVEGQLIHMRKQSAKILELEALNKHLHSIHEEHFILKQTIEEQNNKILKLEALNTNLQSKHKVNVQEFKNINEIIQDERNKNEIIQDDINTVQEKNDDFEQIIENLENRLQKKDKIIQKSAETNNENVQNLENEINEKKLLIKNNNLKFEHQLKKKEMFIDIHKKTIEKLNIQNSKIEEILEKHVNQTLKKRKSFENAIELQHKIFLEKSKTLKKLEIKIEIIEKKYSNYFLTMKNFKEENQIDEIQNLKKENHQMKKDNKKYVNDCNFQPVSDSDIVTSKENITYINDLEKRMKIKDKMIEEQKFQIEVMQKKVQGGNYADSFFEQINTANELYRVKDNYLQSQTRIRQLQESLKRCEEKLGIYEKKYIKYLTQQPESDQSVNIKDEINLELELQKHRLENRNLQLELSKHKVNSIQNKHHKLELYKLEKENEVLKKVNEINMISDGSTPKNILKLGKTNFEKKVKTMQQKLENLKKQELLIYIDKKIEGGFYVNHITNKYTGKLEKMLN